MERKDPPLWQDPKDGTWKAANIWCAGQTFTADGELVVFGGNLEFPNPTAIPPTDYKGLNKVYTFDPFSETWQEQPDMAHGRWYPSGIRLPDGRIPILSGWDESGLDVMNEDVEIFNPASTIGGTGSIGLIGHTGGTGEPPTGEYYPHMFAMPSGKTLIVGPDQFNTWYMNTPTASSFSWSPVAPLDQRRLWGTAVMLPSATGVSGKIMALGGTNESTVHSTNTTAVFDESNPGAGWQSAASNVIGRGHANTVLLPDGSMVEVGGGVGSDPTIPGYDAASRQFAAYPEQRQIELWDPATGQWQLGPAQAESRAYHSTAMLLPDGRVMSAGDDFNGGINQRHRRDLQAALPVQGHASVDHRPPRRRSSSAPASRSTTPDDDITKATLMAPSAVTHAVDMNQRFVALQVTQHDGCVDLVAPANANVAPSGWYMLFLLNRLGRAFRGQVGEAPVHRQRERLRRPADRHRGADGLDQAARERRDRVRARSASPPRRTTTSASPGVQLVLDNQNLGGEDTSFPYTRTWDTTTVADGQHQLKAVARDAAGNTKTSTTVTVTVANHPPDTTPPTVSVSRPRRARARPGRWPSGPAPPTTSGVVGVQFKLDGSNLGAEDGLAPYSTDWDTTDGVQRDPPAHAPWHATPPATRRPRRPCR